MPDLPAGWFSPPDIAFYRHIYWKLVPTRGHTAEVGVHHGRSLMSVAEVIKAKRISVLAVDSWEPWAAGGSGGKDTGQTARERYTEAKHTNGLDNYVTDMAMSSVDAASRIFDQSLDFVFIDADHRYASVVADIKAWLPKIKQGGYIGGHDYYLYPDVAGAVATVLKCVPEVGPNSEVWLWKVE